MSASRQAGGIALLCDTQGTIVEVIRNDPGVDLVAGGSFFDLSEGASRDKSRRMVAELLAEGAAYDWELSVKVGQTYRTMHFTGGRQQDRMLLLGTAAREDVQTLFEQLASINNEHVKQLRGLLKDQMRDRAADSSTASQFDDLTRLNNELAATQRQMAKTNVQLEQLNQQKNQFLGMAAHDLRTPLGIIETYSEFLLQDLRGLTPDQLDFLETIKASSEFMLRMVNDLLDISKIEAGDLALDVTRTDLDELVERVVTMNRVFARRKDIAIEVTTGHNLQEVAVDAGKIEQVLNNLLSNAIKFSRRGTCVRVGLERHGEEAILLTVADEGQGIPAAEMDKLFQPFTKTSTRTTEGESSTGLGLAICRRIVEGHGGQIEADSEVGRGTTFSIRLPDPPVADDVRETAADVEGPTKTDRSLEILVAEDNPVSRKLIMRLLQKRNHVVVVVEDGQAAVQAVQAEPERFDAVLMDLEMPVLDGLGATETIKGSNPDLPIVALTAHRSAEQRDRCLVAGMHALLTKPVKGADLEATLARLPAR